MELISAIANGFALAQQWLFETAFEPLIRLLGLTVFMEDGFEATEWFLLGGIEVLLLFVLLRPLEKLRPAEAEVHNAERRKAVRTDVIYTLLHRLGGFSLLAFFLLRPIADEIEGQLRLAGFERTSLDSLMPWLDNYALLQFLLYLVILDFADYWIHRGQHRIDKWWALHSLHHAQTHMTLWSDNRNHLLDDLIRDALLVALALLIGVEPGQFVWLLIASRAIQSLSHANVKMDFGGIGKYFIVSPQFHRVHHGIGIGHEGSARGVNFGVLFAWWDVLFGTADFKTALQPTGVRDQLSGRQYGAGFWAQQWLGIKRLVNRA
jgi:sterol desaturase/sphingolipid hydroxylase (fatty acid hydroxylase superfamily)